MKNLSYLLLALALFTFSAYAETEPNDDANDANVLVLNGNDIGNLTSPDNNDRWKVTITQDGKLTINTTSGLDVCVISYLYDQNTTTGLANTYPPPCTETNRTMTYNNLMPGTYYIKCTRYSGNGAYTISNQFTPASLSNDTEPNDMSSQAQVLPVNGSMTGHLGYYGNGITDMNDWWKITILEDGKLTINTLSNLTLCVVSYLYDQNATTELTNTYPPSCSDTNRTMIYNNLTPGTYYIKSNRLSGYGSYTIASQFTPASLPNDTEPNDISSEAQVLPVNGSMTGHLGYYGNGITDMNDWWKITILVDGKLTINTLSNLSLCVVSYLYDQNATTELANTYPPPLFRY